MSRDAQNSAETAASEAVGKPFAKGQSGNPGGRPKLDPDVKAALKAACPAAARRLVELSESDDENIAYRASVAILERVYGKPQQRVDIEHGFGEMTDEQLEARFRALREKEPSPDPEPTS